MKGGIYLIFLFFINLINIYSDNIDISGIYYGEAIFYRRNPALRKVEEYRDNKLYHIYFYNREKNKLIVNAKDVSQNIDYLYEEIIYLKNQDIIKNFLNNNKLSLYTVITYDNNKIIKIESKFYYGTPSDSTTTFKYNNKNLIIEESSNFVTKKIIYSPDNKIKQIYYTNFNESEYFYYESSKKYVCIPSLEDYFPDYGSSVKYDKRVHEEHEQNDIKIINDNYYLNGKIYKSKIRKFKGNNIVEYIYNHNQFGEVKYYFYYADNNFFVPKIDNLRFRETPTLDGKFIRLLVKGEKLELLEKGKEETINGVKGTWVKVKSEKGEVGWCFDAYLEEVK